MLFYYPQMLFCFFEIELSGSYRVKERERGGTKWHYNNREKLGVNDTARADRELPNAENGVCVFSKQIHGWARYCAEGVTPSQPSNVAYIGNR